MKIDAFELPPALLRMLQPHCTRQGWQLASDTQQPDCRLAGAMGWGDAVPSLLLTQDDAAAKQWVEEGGAVLRLPVRLGQVLGWCLVAARQHQLRPVKLGAGEFDHAGRRITNAASSISLTEKECQLLHALITKPVSSKEQLLSELWGWHASSDTHTLETHIYRLRQKLQQVNLAEIIKQDDGYQLLPLD